MTPLIDGDLFLHEMGWSGQFKDKDTGEEILLDFDHVASLIENKLQIIKLETESDKDPIIFLSDNSWLNSMRNKRRKWLGEEEIEYVPGFRYEVAKTKPYKGTRKNPKPFHFKNITSYFLGEYNTIVSRDGLEADDELCIYQCANEDTIICSRDKDLRICPGWHYSWECGNQYAMGPNHTDRLGWLEQLGDKTVGFGLAFFYYQMLVGDAADNIPGLPGCGDKKALKLFEEHSPETEVEMCQMVKKAYKEKEMDKKYFMEQANLLWLQQERGVGYEFPK